MIQFNNQPTGKCKKYVQRREAKYGVITCAVALGIIGIPVILSLIFFTSADWEFVLAVCIPTMLFILAVAYISPFSKGSESSILPSKITIYDDGTMESQSEKFHWTQKINEVDHVDDMGEWYQIVFVSTAKNLRFICQKDLIATGTIEEFEALFECKIIRKY